MVTMHLEDTYICDRCKKEITSFLKMQTTRASINDNLTRSILVKGSYILCDKCADDFTDRFIDGYRHDSDEVKGGDNDA